MEGNFWTTITHHCIEALAFLLLIILGIELVAKHLVYALEAIRKVYLKIKNWKNDEEIKTLSESKQETVR